MDFFGHDKISDESMLLFLDFNTIFVKCKVFNTLKTCLNKDMFQKMSKKVAEKIAKISNSLNKSSDLTKFSKQKQIKV